MAGRLGLIGLAVLWVLPGAMAATSSRIDILPDEAARSPSETIDVGAVKPIARPAQPANKPIPRGNPLWSVPLSALTATQERPIFSASRRPPPRAVAAMPVEETNTPRPSKPADAPPPLVLVGAVVGEGDAIAILLDRTDQKVIRLRQGESRAGWALSTVQPREVTLKQGERNEVLTLQRLEAPPPPLPGMPSMPPALAGAPSSSSGQLVSPAAGDRSFAPYIPRSTPKNGEPDGL